MDAMGDASLPAAMRGKPAMSIPCADISDVRSTIKDLRRRGINEFWCSDALAPEALLTICVDGEQCDAC